MAAYLAPAAVLMVLGWWRSGGRWPAAWACWPWLQVAARRWVALHAARGTAPPESLLLTALMMVGPVVLASLLFVTDAWSRRRHDAADLDPARRRTHRFRRRTALLVLPLLAVVALSLTAGARPPGAARRRARGEPG